MSYNAVSRSDTVEARMNRIEDAVWRLHSFFIEKSEFQEYLKNVVTYKFLEEGLDEMDGQINELSEVSTRISVKWDRVRVKQYERVD